jgi:hypothetical protein
MRDIYYCFFAYIFLGGFIIFLILSLLALNGNKILIVEYGIKNFKNEEEKISEDISKYNIHNIKKLLFFQLLISSIIDLILFLLFYIRYNCHFKFFKSDLIEQIENNNIINNNIDNNDNNLIDNNIIDNTQ